MSRGRDARRQRTSVRGPRCSTKLDFPAGLQDPATVLPAETVETTQAAQLGDTTLELHYVGLNHSDSSLVMRLP